MEHPFSAEGRRRTSATRFLANGRPLLFQQGLLVAKLAWTFQLLQEVLLNVEIIRLPQVFFLQLLQLELDLLLESIGLLASGLLFRFPFIIVIGFPPLSFALGFGLVTR